MTCGNRLHGSDTHSLTPWSGCRLLGVDGSPLKIHGQASTKLEFQNKEFKVDIVIAEALSAEAILGLNFLAQIQAKIDLANQKIVLPDDLELLLAKGGSTDCGNNTTDQLVHILSVCLLEGLKISPLSKNKVMASVVDQVADDKQWMFEAVERSRLPVAIARAVVRPKLGQIPVQLVNARSTVVTLYPKTTPGILEELADSEPTTSDQTVAIAKSERIGPEVVEKLEQIVEQNGIFLTKEQKVEFLELLMTFPSVLPLQVMTWDAQLSLNTTLKQVLPPLFTSQFAAYYQLS